MTVPGELLGRFPTGVSVADTVCGRLGSMGLRCVVMDTVSGAETRGLCERLEMGVCPPRHVRTGSECHMLPGIYVLTTCPCMGKVGLGG